MPIYVAWKMHAKVCNLRMTRRELERWREFLGRLRLCVWWSFIGVYGDSGSHYTTIPTQLSRKNFSRCLRIFIFVHGLRSLRWQFSFLRQARNIFNFHFCKTAGQSGYPVSFSFAMAAKPIYYYCTLLDKAANRLLYAVGKFDKRYVCRLQLEKNLCDIAFCYIFIPKCDMAKWHIGI